MEWNIVALECRPQDGSLTDVVITAHWTLNAVDGEFTGSVYGTASFEPPDEKAFTPFNEITKEQAIAWTKAALGEESVANYEANVLAQIEAKRSPTVITPPLPWATPAPQPVV